MARKLKVFVTPAGFHDAYVAAPSRKAALAAWGSDADLFARGVAAEVTDETLMAEPLANPGEVVKRSRGTAAEQLASVPAGKPKRKPAAKAAPARKAEPKPDSKALDDAEEAVGAMDRRHRAARRDLATRQAAIDREKRELADEAVTVTEARDKARGAYDAAMRKWRGRSVHAKTRRREERVRSRRGAEDAEV